MVFSKGRLTAFRLISEMRRLVEKFPEGYGGWERAQKASYQEKAPEPSYQEQAQGPSYREQAQEPFYQEKVAETSYPEQAHEAFHQVPEKMVTRAEITQL